MKELTLQEIKDVELDILKMFDAFCKKNNIRYFLAFGSLLGAIRYKKYIPWDDDIDVLVPREDYDKLLSIFQDNERFRLYAFEKDPKFHFPFAKLCDMTTIKEETIYPIKDIVMGIDMDIFPLDTFDNNIDNAKKEVKIIQKYMLRLGRTKLTKPLSNNPVKYFVKYILMFFCKVIGGGYFVKKIIKESNKSEQKGSSYLGAKVWCIWGERGIIPAEVFKETIEVEFEGQMFPAPIGWDTYLTCLYGDYLPEPPKEKQKTHHDFKAYRI